MGRILVIDDEVAGLREALAGALDHHALFYAESGRKGLDFLADHADVDCVLLDIRMPAELGTQPRREGLAVLGEIKRRRPNLPVVMLTALPEAESAAEALEGGAFHYLTKPLDVPALRAIVSAAIADYELRSRLAVLEGAIRARDRADSLETTQAGGPRFGRLVGVSRPMQRVFDKIARVAPRNLPVLILGASGTGKELVAHEIHDRSDRAAGPFVPVNSASIPRELLESTLFGHKKGAFTGAVSDRIGDFVQADGGTLFLDEIADMPLELQAKLLRALQDQRVRPVGAQDYRQVDVRIISATNADIDALVEQGAFRTDLFYRLNVFRIHLPRLAERKEDIPSLSRHFIRKHRKELRTLVQHISPDALQELAAQPWPGNARELEHMIQAAAALCDRPVLTAEHVKAVLTPSPESATPADAANALWRDALAGRTPKSLVDFRNTHGEQALRNVMRHALDITGNARSAARLLGFLPDESTERAYNNFRKWLSRLGVRRIED